MKNITLFLQKHSQVIYNLFLFVVAAMAILYVLPEHGRLKYDHELGQPWLHNDLEAPFSFPIYKSRDELNREKANWEENYPLYFRRDKSAEEESILELEDALSRIPIDFYKTHRIELEKVPEQLRSLYESGVVIHPTVQSPHMRIWYLANDGVFTLVDPDQFIPSDEISRRVARMLENVGNEELREVIKGLLTQVVVPNIRFNNELTQKRKDEHLERLSPTIGMISEGEVIVHNGQTVDEQVEKRILSYKRSLEGTEDDTAIWQVRLGHFLLIVLVLLMVYLFLQQFRSPILQNSNSLTLILVNMVGMVLLADFILRINPNLIYLTPFPIVPIILRSFYDTRLALFVHIMVIVLVGLVAPNSFEFIFLQLMAGIFSIVTAAGLYRRAELVIASAKVTGVYIVSYFAFTLIRGDVMDAEHLTQYGYFTLNGLISVMAYPLILLFEKVFGQVSDVTLLELGDTNSPLLRKLRDLAPGTFQHSLQVGNLAESVIAEIGGNTLLVRTGALYHDIGKMNRPLYFVENQTTGINAHDDLDPIESAKIIVGHVQEGIVLAKSKRIPDAIVDFIRTHHGTTRVEYFYRNHIRELQEKEEEITKEEEKAFRYPGPKPFSKETAVMMMADTVEAATRSLNRPTADDISNMVDRLIDNQQSEGQFDNAEITLSEISRARQILKKKLMSIHHLRVEYPD